MATLVLPELDVVELPNTLPTPTPTPNPPDLLVVRLLQEAIICLELYGWIQGSAQDEHGRHCMIGALDYAARRSLIQPLRKCDSYLRARWKLETIVGGCCMSWNDRPGRTVNQVLDAFSLAIESERGGPYGRD